MMEREAARYFSETIKARANADASFRAALLSEAVDLLLNSEVDAGKLVIRDYINATVGFDDLAEEIGKPPKSLMRMFSAKGNPTADNLFAVLRHLQQATGVHLAVAVA